MRITTFWIEEQLANRPQPGSRFPEEPALRIDMQNHVEELRHLYAVPGLLVLEAESWLEGADSYMDAHPTELAYDDAGRELLLDLQRLLQTTAAACQLQLVVREGMWCYEPTDTAEMPDWLADPDYEPHPTPDSDPKDY